MLDKIYVAKKIHVIDSKKLFLCSRQIELEDEFYSDLAPGERFIATSDWRQKHDEDFCYKKIKEISSEAGWVKEGDEFDAEELQPYNGAYHFSVPFSLIATDVVTYIRIFNAACGHFH